ncbi:MAG: hypothetical protein DMD60_04275 [Gemmatimonadetes bacterium]|nr:MAG: hypothetical protein DMD60_04275 [Gemmatimonadota bacterium]
MERGGRRIRRAAPPAAHRDLYAGGAAAVGRGRAPLRWRQPPGRALGLPDPPHRGPGPGVPRVAVEPRRGARRPRGRHPRGGHRSLPDHPPAARGAPVPLVVAGSRGAA